MLHFLQLYVTGQVLFKTIADLHINVCSDYGCVKFWFGNKGDVNGVNGG